MFFLLAILACIPRTVPLLPWANGNGSQKASRATCPGVELFGSHVLFSHVGSALVRRATLPVDAETLAEISYRGAALIRSE